MQAVIELVMTVIAAFALAVFAAVGGGADSLPEIRRANPPAAQRLVARSSEAKPIAEPKTAIDCPEARARASDIA